MFPRLVSELAGAKLEAWDFNKVIIIIIIIIIIIMINIINENKRFFQWIFLEPFCGTSAFYSQSPRDYRLVLIDLSIVIQITFIYVSSVQLRINSLSASIENFQ